MGLFDFIKDFAKGQVSDFVTGPDDALGNTPRSTTGYSDAVAGTVKYIQDQGLPGLNDLKGLLDQGLTKVKDALSNLSVEDGVNAAFALVDLALSRGEPASTVEALRQEAKRLQDLRDRRDFYYGYCTSLERLPDQENQPVNRPCRDLGYNVGPALDIDTGFPIEGPLSVSPKSRTVLYLGVAGVVGYFALKG